MTRRYGIDTSVLVRLITRLPAEDFAYCVNRLSALIEAGAEVFASNQVIGETYVAVQHHYGVSRADARTALKGALQSGLVSPQNGRGVLAILSASNQPGLFDRLITDGYSRAGLQILTLDKKMASLPDVKPL